MFEAFEVKKPFYRLVSFLGVDNNADFRNAI